LNRVAQPIRAIALDVDGVLTDGTFWWGANGEELKRFSFLDVMGIARARRCGTRFALISGEDGPLLTRFAGKLGIEDVFGGCKDKAGALREFAARHSLPLNEICFVGDDVNDVAAMMIAGFAAAPRSAHANARAHATLVTERPGGAGAVREVIDHLASAGRLALDYEIRNDGR
jgi:3-deoxy-D-manno-octulosonate 8-phosphate phosphatase (KDO 8-P phosphatase)